MNFTQGLLFDASITINFIPLDVITLCGVHAFPPLTSMLYLQSTCERSEHAQDKSFLVTTDETSRFGREMIFLRELISDYLSFLTRLFYRERKTLMKIVLIALCVFGNQLLYGSQTPRLGPY